MIVQLHMYHAWLTHSFQQSGENAEGNQILGQISTLSCCLNHVWATHTHTHTPLQLDISPPKPNVPPPILLNPMASMTAGDFEKNWLSMPTK